MQSEGRLLHSFRAGKLKHAATLDDYANMTRAAVSLYEATGNADYIDTAQSWIGVLDTHFWDADCGGYFFTADDAEALIIRTKSAADNATPAGNSIIAATLARLHYLTGEDPYRTRAEEIFTAFGGEVSKNFFTLAGLLCANEILQHCAQVVIIGEREDEDANALLDTVWKSPNINKLIQRIAPDEALPDGHPATGKWQEGGRATAYVCIGQTCSLPLTTPAALRDAL